jgi:hypothetical protein
MVSASTSRLALAILACPLLLGAAIQQPKPAPAKSRTFQFTYDAIINKLPAGKMAKVWVPLPATTPDQDIAIEKESLPVKGSIATEPLYGNKILSFEAMPGNDGSLALSLTFKVTRREVKTDGGNFRKPGDKEKIERYLEADRLVPITGRPLELLKEVKLDKDPFKVARALYDLVNGHMKYS